MVDGSDRFVRLAEVSDPGAARVYAALLDSAGIPVRLHGEALGPYVMTVGDWAVTELWVPESAWDDAVEILSGEALPPGVVLQSPPQRPATGLWPKWTVALAMGVALALAVLWIVGSRL